MRNFISNREGISYILATAFIAILLLPVAYFPLDYAFDQVYANVTNGYVFTGTIGSAVTAVILIIAYLPAFGVAYTIVYAFTHAKKERYE